MMLDYLITGAQVFDGINPEPRMVSVGIQGEKITYISTPASDLNASDLKASVHINATGLYLCPGFIDTHASTGLGYRFPHAGDNKLFQGITTEIIGNCGTSTAPIGDLLVPTMERLAREIGFTFDWRTFDQWSEGVANYGLPFNVGTFIGHSTLRGGICRDMQQVTRREIDQMCAMVDQAMSDGALGLSTGLVYAPGSFAETQEIVELARVVARHGGIYVSHIRDERQQLEASIDEAIEIGQSAGVPVLVSHLKAAEKPNWGKIPQVIDHLEVARAQGVEITFEVYPYAATSTKMRTFIPKSTLADGVMGMVKKLGTDYWRQKSIAWLLERGTDFEAMVLITDSIPGAAGKSVAGLAQDNNRDPAHMLVDILIEDPDAWIVYHCISENDMDAAILWPDSIICSDSWSYPVNAPKQIGLPHPRTYGAFTRFLEQYALKRSRLTFGEAVRKISSLPAQWLKLPYRGRIDEGCFADLVLLDPIKVREKATYTNPRQLSEGAAYVWVNGTLMLEGGLINLESPGHIIRHENV